MSETQLEINGVTYSGKDLDLICLGMSLKQDSVIDFLENYSLLAESPSVIFSNTISDYEFKLADGNDVVEVNFAHEAFREQLARIIIVIKGEK
jgi:hypothetical protein